VKLLWHFRSYTIEGKESEELRWHDFFTLVFLVSFRGFVEFFRHQKEKDPKNSEAALIHLWIE
jgi:hypothetical protein